eukprot:11340282-Heterocapsa_arctica.AAC.1
MSQNLTSDCLCWRQQAVAQSLSLFLSSARRCPRAAVVRCASRAVRAAALAALRPPRSDYAAKHSLSLSQICIDVWINRPG